MSLTTSKGVPVGGTFSHEALFYEGARGFMEGTLPFINEGIADSEPVLVVVGESKIEALRGELGRDADRVTFADMARVGHNPARIIPAWKAFLDEHALGARSVRGIGEPIWAGRSAEELVECQQHEALLNVAFAGSSPWRLMCPYDVTTLPKDVLDEAQRSHPLFWTSGRGTTSRDYRGLTNTGGPFDSPLAAPPADAAEMLLEVDRLHDARVFVEVNARAAGLTREATTDLLLAMSEVAANSFRHGGGRGTLRVWADPATFYCEVRDRGRMDQPLAGRRRPVFGQENGFGLWLTNQLCDLVQIRMGRDGTTVRMHISRG
jgi:anti-sigma regulatory factor (Ser/Thr protein kinase)